MGEVLEASMASFAILEGHNHYEGRLSHTRLSSDHRAGDANPKSRGVARLGLTVAVVTVWKNSQS